MERIYFDTIDSTNEEAKRMLRNNELSADILMRALEQSAGKGRLGRSWSSKKGEGLYISIVKEVDIRNNPSILTIAAAVAVFKTLEPLGISDLHIKWPNDILVGRRKLCGILSELIEVDNKFFAIIGIGINVSNRVFPDDLKTKATSLLLEGIDVDSEDLLDHLELSFEEVYNEIKDKWILENFVDFLNKNLLALGEEVNFTYKDEELCGIIGGINNDGTLRLISEGRTLDIASGEITLKDFYTC